MEYQTVVVVIAYGIGDDAPVVQVQDGLADFRPDGILELGYVRMPDEAQRRLLSNFFTFFNRALSISRSQFFRSRWATCMYPEVLMAMIHPQPIPVLPGIPDSVPFADFLTRCIQSSLTNTILQCGSFPLP